jgi:hypothetical protein
MKPEPCVERSETPASPGPNPFLPGRRERSERPRGSAREAEAEAVQ